MLLTDKFVRFFLITARLMICLWLTTCSLIGFSQDAAQVRTLFNSAADYRSRFPAEKLYLQLDRPYYTTGDTIWFKTYLFDAATYTPSAQSNKVYVELLNDSSRVINRFAVPLIYGLGQGTIILDEKIADGSYTIRAYTNWMQNFGDELFFNKQFYIGRPSAQGSWLVNEQHTVMPAAEGSRVKMAVHLITLNQATVPYRDIEMRLSDGKRTLLKNNYTTSDDGNITTDFIIPPKSDGQKLTVVITDKLTKNNYSFPFYPGGELQKADLQFMPEGGDLIAGLTSRIAFKAIGDDGMGLNIKGIVVNSNGQQVSSFASTHNGIGNFVLYPEINQSYWAKFESGEISRSVALPAVLPSGVSLKIDNLSVPDSILVYIRTTPNIAAAGKNFSMVVQSQSEVYRGAVLQLTSGFTNFHLAKNAFASGIVSFDILDESKTLICQRRIFIDHHDRLNIDVTSYKKDHLPKDSIALMLNVCGNDGTPVKGSFSVSVTNDEYVKTLAESDNIISQLLLTSELKGNIENAGWYFTANDPRRYEALDNLLLAQAWTGFDWQKASLPAVKPAFYPEKDNRLTGNLRNLFNKPVKDAKLNLFSVSKKYGVITMDTTSDAKGDFVFDRLPSYDTIVYTLHVNNKKNNASTATIKLDEFKPAKINPSGNPEIKPWYFHPADSLMINSFNIPRSPAIAGVAIEGKLLHEVTVKAGKKSVLTAGMSGFVTREITEKELVEAGNLTLYDLLVRKVKSFSLSFTYSDSVFGGAYIHSNPAPVLGIEKVADMVIDGQRSNILYGSSSPLDPPNGDLRILIDFLQSTSADEVVNIKLVRGLYTFITITTRSGLGYFTTTSPNIIRYKPVPLCMPRQFYRPRYTVNTTVSIAPRPTIHWEPNLVTDKKGSATLSFYAADKPGSYTIIVEGADMNGNFGYQTAKLVISAPVAAPKADNTTGSNKL